MNNICATQYGGRWLRRQSGKPGAMYTITGHKIFLGWSQGGINIYFRKPKHSVFQSTCSACRKLRVLSEKSGIHSIQKIPGFSYCSSNSYYKLVTVHIVFTSNLKWIWSTAHEIWPHWGSMSEPHITALKVKFVHTVRMYASPYITAGVVMRRYGHHMPHLISFVEQVCKTTLEWCQQRERERTSAEILDKRAAALCRLRIATLLILAPHILHSPSNINSSCFNSQ